ncbi:hypothetical protein JCM10212_006034 [Sporobolomyces blumeae]
MSIKGSRRQTYVMHAAPTLDDPRPLPILTLSSHHLVVVESDRRDLARAHAFPLFLPSVPEFGASFDDGDHSSSLSTCPSTSLSTSTSLACSSVVEELDLAASPRSYFSDDSTSQLGECACGCADRTLTREQQFCTACLGLQDFPEDEDSCINDVDSLLESYLDEYEAEAERSRWREVSTVSSVSSPSSESSSSCASSHYDPLFSPRSSSTTFTAVSIAARRSKPSFNAPLDLRDFDMILTSAPPSPQSKRFSRSTIEAIKRNSHHEPMRANPQGPSSSSARRPQVLVDSSKPLPKMPQEAHRAGSINQEMVEGPRHSAPFKPSLYLDEPRPPPAAHLGRRPPDQQASTSDEDAKHVAPVRRHRPVARPWTPDGTPPQHPHWAGTRDGPLERPVVLQPFDKVQDGRDQTKKSWNPWAW